MSKINLVAATVATLAVVPSFAAAQDWSGPYAGLLLGNTGGTIDTTIGSSFDFGGSQRGAFVGYNMQKGALVYGGELAFVTGDAPLDAVPTQGMDRFIDLKGRLGYAAGSVLMFGVVGYSKDRTYVTGATSSGSGMSYGIGADVKVGEKLFVGAEYLRRNVTNDATGSIVGFDADVDTISLRLGYSF